MGPQYVIPSSAAEEHGATYAAERRNPTRNENAEAWQKNAHCLAQ